MLPIIIKYYLPNDYIDIGYFMQRFWFIAIDDLFTIIVNNFIEQSQRGNCIKIQK